MRLAVLTFGLSALVAVSVLGCSSSSGGMMSMSNPNTGTSGGASSGKPPPSSAGRGAAGVMATVPPASAGDAARTAGHSGSSCGVSGTSTPSAPVDEAAIAIANKACSSGLMADIAVLQDGTAIFCGAGEYYGLAYEANVSSGRVTFSDAQNYCSRLTLAGRDWRLPTIDELEAVSKWNGQVPFSARGILPGQPQEPFWSATAAPDSPGSLLLWDFTL
jgi:hypothetical protein